MYNFKVVSVFLSLSRLFYTCLCVCSMHVCMFKDGIFSRNDILSCCFPIISHLVFCLLYDNVSRVVSVTKCGLVIVACPLRFYTVINAKLVLVFNFRMQQPTVTQITFVSPSVFSFAVFFSLSFMNNFTAQWPCLC